jgi:hypothetical protein
MTLVSQFNWAKNIRPEKNPPSSISGILIKTGSINKILNAQAAAANNKSGSAAGISSSENEVTVKEFTEFSANNNNPKWTYVVNDLLNTGKLSQSNWTIIKQLGLKNKTSKDSVSSLSSSFCDFINTLKNGFTNEIGGIIRDDKIFGWEGSVGSVGINENLINTSTHLIGHTHNWQNDPGLPSPGDMEISQNDKRKLYVQIVAGIHYITTYFNGKVTAVYNIQDNKSYFDSMDNGKLKSGTGEKAGQDAWWIVNKKTGNYTSYYNLIGLDGRTYYFGDKSFKQNSGSGGSGGSQGEGGAQGAKAAQEENSIMLLDDNGVAYTEEQISFQWSNFTGTDGTKRLPKIWEFDDNGSVITEGAKLVIGFINNDYQKPIITGCLENLAAQNTFQPAAGTNLEVSNREIDNNHNENFRVTRTVSPDGDMIIELENLNDKPIRYYLNVKGSKSDIYINSEGNTYIGNDYNHIQFDKDKIFIGSKDLAGKAKEVGINAERVILGNSTFYNPKLGGQQNAGIDFLNNPDTLISEFPATLAPTFPEEGSLHKVQHQWAVMGETLVYLLKRMIDIWKGAMYQGDSICWVSEDDQRTMERDVYNKLPLILSSCVSLINRPEDPKIES